MEPWGDRRLDLLFSRLSMQIANIVRDDKKHPEPFSITDFIPDWDKMWLEATVQPERTDEQEMSLTEALVGKVIALNQWLGGEGS